MQVILYLCFCKSFKKYHHHKHVKTLEVIKLPRNSNAARSGIFSCKEFEWWNSRVPRISHR
uniref:Putative ovule protein n=1 Tax=Solanum chacoense TaxID=4108 RepID=A0A0V0GV87_SOLCH